MPLSREKQGGRGKGTGMGKRTRTQELGHKRELYNFWYELLKRNPDYSRWLKMTKRRDPSAGAALTDDDQAFLKEHDHQFARLFIIFGDVHANKFEVIWKRTKNKYLPAVYDFITDAGCNSATSALDAYNTIKCSGGRLFVISIHDNSDAEIIDAFNAALKQARKDFTKSDTKRAERLWPLYLRLYDLVTAKPPGRINWNPIIQKITREFPGIAPSPNRKGVDVVPKTYQEKADHFHKLYKKAQDLIKKAASPSFLMET